ncbi:MAG: hypothetical protein ACM3U1_04060 [Chloroflexota bacterium]
MKNYVKRLAFLLAATLMLASFNAEAATKVRSKKDKGDSEELQAKQLRSVYDLQQNTVSNVQFYTTNYGIFGFNISQSGGIGGGYWPRGSVNQYIFGGGVWFAAQKPNPSITDQVQYRKYVEVSYNPNSGTSWMVPGRIEDGDNVDPNDIETYRTYFSIDFKADGTPLDPSVQGNWPVWDASREAKDTLKKNRYFGYFIKDNAERNRTTYPKGPAYISEEDIFCTFKDTDLNRYEGGVAQRKKEGYPLRLQYEHTIYSWGFGDYRDFIFLRYDITNLSNDTLRECWLAPVMDVDIAVAPNTRRGADNDRVRYHSTDTTLNLAYQWTNPDLGERGRGFGYLGFDFLESPAVQIAYREDDIKDSLGNVIGKKKTPIIVEGYSGFVRKDSAFYHNSSQLGLRTFRNWSIDDDKLADEARYDFMSLGQREGETGPGDKRFMMATGPFHMRPKDTVRVIVGIILANAAKGADADGTEADIAELIRKDKFAQAVYDNNFQAPMPPDASVITNWTPLNNAIQLTWDSTAELSVDPYENGLDFMGFRIYRARRTNLDTFDLNIIEGNNQYPSGKGPLGWKELASYQMRPPFWKSPYRGGMDESNTRMPFIDQIWVLGPSIVQENGINKFDTMAIKVMRIPFGTQPISEVQVYNQTGIYAPVLTSIDTSALSRPWGAFFNKLAKEDGLNFDAPIQTKLTWPSKNYKLFNEALIGTVKLNPALMAYNPLYFREVATTIDTAYFNAFIRNKSDGIVGPTDTIPEFTDDKGHVHPQQIIRTRIDSVYQLSTGRWLNSDFVVNVLIPRDINQVLRDPNHIVSIQESIYEWVKSGYAKIEFPQIEENADLRYNYIAPYMREITNNRTFTDIGDDNKNGYIDTDENPIKTEKLLNNIDYYYKVLAFDEGDYNQPTPIKLNSAQEGRPNFIQTTPKSAPVSKNSQFVISITPEDSAKFGGIYNFQAFPVDQERVNQLLSGHTLELEFQPLWRRYEAKFPGRNEQDALKFGLYQQRLKLTDLTTGKTLYDAGYMFETQPCDLSFREAFTENAGSYIWADSAIVDPIRGDTNTFALRDNRESLLRSGTFTTGNFRDKGYCYSTYFNSDVYGTLGFSFDYTMKQFGGWYRPDLTTLDSYNSYVAGKSISTPLGIADNGGSKLDEDVILKTQEVAYDYYYNALLAAGFNNGPGEYELEFLPGGTEKMTLEWGAENAKQTDEFTVPYLNVRMRNISTYNRPALNNVNDSVLVRYPLEMPHIEIPMAFTDVINPQTGAVLLSKKLYPDPRNFLAKGAHYDSLESNKFIGKFNIAASGYVNVRDYKPLQAKNYVARPAAEPYRSATNTYVGTQGRYYLTGTSTRGNQIDFTHTINVGGINFGLIYANVWTNSWGLNFGSRITNYTFGKDFEAGDKIVLKTIGGAQGMPLPGAKIRINVTPIDTTTKNITDDMMDEVGVTPNPYVISHIGQKSPYDSQIFFTKLPTRCTIQIYTVAGDLVRTLEHDAFTSPLGAKESVEVWDILTVNGTRSASQGFVAVITTPDGAQTYKTFSVILGGFRLSSEE